MNKFEEAALWALAFIGSAFVYLNAPDTLVGWPKLWGACVVGAGFAFSVRGLARWFLALLGRYGHDWRQG